MIRISNVDYKKLIKLLDKEGQDGAPLTIRTDGTKLSITTMDRSNKEMIIELSDLDYPFLPRITKVETF